MTSHCHQLSPVRSYEKKVTQRGWGPFYTPLDRQDATFAPPADQAVLLQSYPLLWSLLGQARLIPQTRDPWQDFYLAVRAGVQLVLGRITIYVQTQRVKTMSPVGTGPLVTPAGRSHRDTGHSYARDVLYEVFPVILTSCTGHSDERDPTRPGPSLHSNITGKLINRTGAFS